MIAIRLAGLRGLVADLSDLENRLGVPIAGLIGYNVLEKFQIQFDYASRELSLFALDDDAQPLRENGLGSPALVSAFDMVGHIPVFPVQIAGLDLRMGLDSGAGDAMIFTRWQEALAGEYEFVRRDELRGAGTDVQMGDVVKIEKMTLQNLEYTDLEFRFNDIAAHGDQPLPMDGLLGYNFLRTRTTAINFRTQELLIWAQPDS